MKISYIVTPFQDAAYLIRCINSLERQLDCDFEIILSGCDIKKSEKIDVFLQEHPEVIISSSNACEDSDEKKLNAAWKFSQGDYIVFLDVTTITAPFAGKYIVEFPTSDLVFLQMVDYQNNTYMFSNEKVINLEKTANWKLFRYSRGILEKYGDILFEHPEIIHHLVDLQLSEGKSIGQIDGVCFYCKHLLNEGSVDIVIDEKISKKIAENICKVPVTALKINIFKRQLDYYISILMAGIKDEEMQERVYGILKFFREKSIHNIFMSRMFEDIIGCPIEIHKELDYRGYLEYRSLKKDLIFTTEKNMEVIYLQLNEKMFMQEKALQEINKIIKKTEEDLEILKTNQHFMAQNIEIVKSGISVEDNLQTRYVNYVQEVPLLFFQGRLGLRVILRSISAWLKYKLRINRK